jgi:hypothetical protein
MLQNCRLGSLDIDALTQKGGVYICFILMVTNVISTLKLTNGIAAKSQSLLLSRKTLRNRIELLPPSFPCFSPSQPHLPHLSKSSPENCSRAPDLSTTHSMMEVPLST